MSDPTPAKRPQLVSLWTLLQWLKRYRTAVSIAGVALVITSAAQLSLGYGVRLLIDSGFSDGSLQGLRTAIGYLLLVSGVMAVGTFARFYWVSWLGERVSADLRRAVFANLIRLQPSFFETNQSTEIISRLTTDTTLLQTLIGSSISMAARNTLTLLGALTLMLITNIKLSGIILVIVPITVLPILLFGRRVRKLSKSSQDSIAHVGSYAGEVLQAIKVVQSFVREEHEIQQFDKEVERAFQTAKKRVTQRALLIGVAIILLLGGLIAMIWVGGQDVLSGAMSPGDLGAFAFYALMVGSAFAALSEVWGDLQRAAGAAERLAELLNAKSTLPNGAQTENIARRAALRFDHVSFCYPSRPTQFALKELCLTIQPGQSLALVGPSGAGKSTVFELLQRFYDPSSGTVYYGDQSLKGLELAAWRRKIAVVHQNPQLFTGNIHDNIAYGNIGASRDRVIAAAKAAHADEFIQQLPEGYNSIIGTQGVQLSGGQRQRIALARAIIADPEILLLDEATSALDTESENLVQKALDVIMRDRTTVIIAHRLSTVQKADQIAVIDAGQVVAIGTHRELLEKSDLYQRLAALQFAT
jgi:ATP-binding cassette subfamily B protein